MALDEVGAGDFAYDEYINYIVRRAINRPTTRLVLTANQTLTTATTTALAFGAGSEVYDDLNWHNIASFTSRVTPLYAGRYLVVGNVTFTGNATGDRRVMPAKNGNATAAFVRQPASAVSQSFGFTDVIEMNGSSDYLEILAYQSSGGNLAVVGSRDVGVSSMFFVTYMGDTA